MLHNHLFKILAIFVVILGLGLVSFSIISKYQQGGTQAKALQGR